MSGKARTRRQKEKLSLTLPGSLTKPRNPLVLAARQRVAGAHRKSKSAERQQQRRSLRNSLNEE